MLKSARFHLPAFCGSESVFVFSFFHPLLFVIFFVQPVKCPLDRVREETTGSTPLNDQTNGQNQQNPACGLFYKSGPGIKVNEGGI